MHIQIGHQDSLNTSSLHTYDDLVRTLNDILGENTYIIEKDGRKVDLSGQHELLEDAAYRIWPKVLGGKGGFGSLLRSFGKQILISKNKEACRDLNGRRMRDVNNEKKLKEWMQKQLDKPSTSSTDQRSKPSLDEEKQDYRSVPPPHKFSDTAYDEQKKQIADDISEAVQIAAEFIHAEKVKKKKTSTAISTRDDDEKEKDNDGDDDGKPSTKNKRRHSNDALEDGELKSKKTKTEKGSKSAFFLGIDIGDVSDDEDDDDEDEDESKKKKTAKKI